MCFVPLLAQMPHKAVREHGHGSPGKLRSMELTIDMVPGCWSTNFPHECLVAHGQRCDPAVWQMQAKG